MNNYDQYFNANKELWNQRTAIHKDSAFYDKAAFLNGASTLNEIELSEMGDVKGKKLLHLQCHFGMDSLSWARMGADVTGVDFSEDAIEEAVKLNEQTGCHAKFICCNIYDLPQHLNEKFDLVFTSYGVIGWLPDLDKWAAIIAHYLKPGGIFYMVEFHPVLWMFDDDFKQIKYAYHNAAMIETESQGTYADKDASIKHKEYGWNHSLSEVINSLINHGIQIEFLNEYNYSPYDCFNKTVKVAENKWNIEGMEGKLPMVYSVKGSR